MIYITEKVILIDSDYITINRGDIMSTKIGCIGGGIPGIVIFRIVKNERDF